MTDRDETSGQFSNAEPLVGERAAEAEAGYIPHEEAPVEKGQEDTQALADMITENLGADEPEEVLGLTDPDDTEPKQAISQQQLVDHIADERRAHEGMAEIVNNAEVAAFADNLREYLGPELGIEPKPKTEAAKPEVVQPESEPTPEVQAFMDTGLNRKVAEAIAEPEVRQFLESNVAETQQVREHYTAGLENARLHTLATLAEVVPHLAGLPPQQFQEGLAALSQIDPPAFQTAMNILGRTNAIAQAQQQAQQYQAHVQHQQFEATVGAEDKRLVEMFDGDKAKADEATNATISYLTEHGIPRQQMIQVFKANPVLQTAEARQTIWEAEQYRKIMNTKVTASTRPAPQVQRPGVSVSAAERQASNISAKSAKARSRVDAGSGDAKDLASILGSLRSA
jgi:hypothetical protein